MTTNDAPKRLAPETKRMKLEHVMIEQAIERSIETEQVFNEKIGFSNLDELYAKLKERIDLQKRIVSHRDNILYILYIEDISYPNIKCCVRVSEDFTLRLFYGSRVVTKLNEKFNVPFIVSSVIEIEDILHQVLISMNKKYQDCSAMENINACIDILKSLLVILPQRKPVIEFLLQQVKNLNTLSKGAFRYSWETTLFCGLLQSISPHAYKFLHSSGHLLLPSLSTIKRLCSNFSGNPQVEQNDSTLLQYMASKVKLLRDEDKTVNLMIDEIHIKPYMDYKGGNIVGKAFNSTDCAKSAHVFMINSLLSTYRDVVHILPVKTLDAQTLHNYIEKIVIGLEKLGFEVLSIVSDNNAINSKAMSFFSDPPEVKYLYRNPADSSRPLFFVIDSVHIIKNLRNNWINQKPDQCMHYPDFEEEKMRLASFQALKSMHLSEKNKLLQYGYTLSLKALYPTSIERQNVKLALQIFNSNVATALCELGSKKQFESFEDTAAYIQIICRWWDVVNVKTLEKGNRHRNPYEQHITKNSIHIEFLQKFLLWLERWKNSEGGGKLTRNTHFALFLTTNALIEITNYCLNEKKWSFVLCGKFQTDRLEERFGMYRQQAGGQYHVSIRQVFESESKLRMQSTVPLVLKSTAYGDVEVPYQNISSLLESNEDDEGFVNSGLNNFLL